MHDYASFGDSRLWHPRWYPLLPKGSSAQTEREAPWSHSLRSLSAHTDRSSLNDCVNIGRHIPKAIVDERLFHELEKRLVDILTTNLFFFYIIECVAKSKLTFAENKKTQKNSKLLISVLTNWRYWRILEIAVMESMICMK